MEMRIQELHPALVHLPIMLLPTALGIDAGGRATADPTLLRLGRTGMGAAFVALSVAGMAGLVAQQVSRADEAGRENS